MPMKDYFTTGELAEICHVSPTTIFRAISNKNLRAATTPGGHFRISREDAEDFLRKNNIPIPGAEAKVKKILVVEDNPVELRMFQRALESEATFAVKTTESGYEAGFLTQSFRPDVILLDIFLGDIDGRQVARLIRSDASLRRTKIVAITGAKNAKDLKDIKSLDFDAVIQKPIAPNDLRDVVNRLFT